MFVYEIDGTIRQVNVKSTLDVPMCTYPQIPIVPVLKEEFSNNDYLPNECQYNTRMAFQNYLNHQSINSPTHANQLMTSDFTTMQPWSQDAYFLLQDGNSMNNHLYGFPNTFITNSGLTRYGYRKRDIPAMIAYMCKNAGTSRAWNWQAGMNPSQINY